MSQIVRSTPNRRPTHLQAGEGRPRPADPRQRMEEGKVSSSARPPLTARRRSAMSEMRPVTEREVRDAAERLRQTKAAEDATDVAGVEAGYELAGVSGDHGCLMPSGWPTLMRFCWWHAGLVLDRAAVLVYDLNLWRACTR